MVQSGHLAKGEATMSPPETKTQRVTRVLAERIEAGQYPPGEKLPSNAQLREEFGVSQQVIRLAVDRLKERGLLELRFGVGLYVRGSES